MKNFGVPPKSSGLLVKNISVHCIKHASPNDMTLSDSKPKFFSKRLTDGKQNYPEKVRIWGINFNESRFFSIETKDLS
jgi:hypothetical protein